jgi:NAD(P)-dependent dehydrogenase (short-subunit alcohol dehydrogenase family)
MRRFTRLALMFLFAVPLLVITEASVAQTGKAAEAQKAVLVTGASTGIGRKITERLAADGYFVYASARKESDLKALGTLKNVQPLRLDVTKPEDIAAALDTVTKGGRGLYALVNNAGVGTAGPVIGSSDQEFDLTMDVNVYGPWRVTRAFAPLIIAQKGRISTIGSISGILASRGMSAYAMSKHAIEAFTDSLALEMEAVGVQVSVVEPGNYNSAISQNAVQRVGEAAVKSAGMDPRGVADRSKYKEPDDVAAAVAHALSDPNPKRRYLVVPEQREAEITIRKQIAQLVQLNEGHPYTYDREALVKMLDEALAKSRPRTQAVAAAAN